MLLPVDTPAPPQRHATALLLANHDLRLHLPWRALRVTGPDALSFLQGQVTCDMREVTPTQSRLGCLLNLKGRVQVSFRVLAVDDGFLLLLPAEQLDTAVTRLSKYALFSKVSLTPASPAITGFAGASALGRLPTVPDQAQGVLADADGWLIRLPGEQRLLQVSREDAADTRPDAAALAAWQCLEIRSGEILIASAEQEQFQPQEIDYHTLQGVSYQKGCYLGQEIVARLYFRGQLKAGLQYLRVATSDGAGPQPGQVILAGDQSVGTVLRVSWPDAEHADLLSLVRHDSGSLTLMLDGRALAVQALPFSR